MALDEYNARRDFSRTPEPSGEAAPAAERLRYVIQKHGARRLHYDFRLELDGVLKSWAVPKGPSLAPGERRLAVEVEDHPLDYQSFEGVIPQGEYGGGPVIVWDRGTWTPDGDPHAALDRGTLTFQLDGEKLHGGWRLVRTGGGERGKPAWLLMKRRDAHAHATRSLVDEAPRSVVSGRTLEEVDAGLPPVEVAAPAEALEAALALDPAAAEPPEAVEPQLATAATAAPAGAGWLHEAKLDGYRVIAHKRGETIRVISRNGLDWTHRFPPVAQALARLPLATAILDGEIVVFDRHGSTDFGALQHALSVGAGDYVLVAFDLLWFDGHDLRDHPLRDRKDALRRLIDALPPWDAPAALRYGDDIPGRGPDVLREACRLGLEGIISKRADAPYKSGRGRAWLKVKCGARQELVIVGFTEPAGQRSHLGALLLGVHRDGALRYAGKCGAGLDAETLADLRARLEPLIRDAAPVSEAPRERGRHWVEPQLVAEIAFAGWTRGGRVRQAVFKGLREDKNMQDVVPETPVAPPEPAPPKQKRGPAAIAGVRLTHPDRVLFPEAGVTKRDLAAYLEAVAERMLPYLADRPLSLVRCPEGRTGQCFYQKQPPPGLPDTVARVEVKPGEANLMVRDAAGLVTLAQFGVIEYHPWGARQDRLDRPDVLVFDLDPGDGVSWRRLAATALTLRDRLAALDLCAFLRATGGKGLHVVVPIERRTAWGPAKDFTHAIAREFARADPDHYLARSDKALRPGRIFIDWLRNGRGATAVGNFSPRGRPGAPVAHPLPWDALDLAGDGPPRLTVRDILDGGLPPDPWPDYEASRRRLGKSALALIKE
ncbi:MAG: DNA ligase D [bacterium]